MIDSYGDAIVIDVRYRMSLPVVRSLGRSGVCVHACERESTPYKAALGYYSRWTAEKLRAPAADSDPAGFLSALSHYSSKLKEPPVLIPVGIDSMLTLCKERGQIAPWALAALPSYESIMLANDKGRLIPYAQSIEIPCPETITRLEGENVQTLADRATYPAVLKLPAGELLGLSPQERYAIVNDKSSFVEKYQKMDALSSGLLIQEYVEGDGWGVSAVFDANSRPLSVFCHKRLREYPVSGGPSCYCVSAWNDELAGYAIRLLSELKWVGVAMVEFKGTPERGFRLMEINPRFWGSLALAPAAGCNIPFALYRAARGELAPAPAESLNNKPLCQYKENKKMRFILQDLLSLKGYLKRSGNKIKFLCAFFAGYFNPAVAEGVFSWSDLRSSVRYFINALSKREKIL